MNAARVESRCHISVSYMTYICYFHAVLREQLVHPKQQIYRNSQATIRWSLCNSRYRRHTCGVFLPVLVYCLWQYLSPGFGLESGRSHSSVVLGILGAHRIELRLRFSFSVDTCVID